LNNVRFHCSSSVSFDLLTTIGENQKNLLVQNRILLNVIQRAPIYYSAVFNTVWIFMYRYTPLLDLAKTRFASLRSNTIRYKYDIVHIFATLDTVLKIKNKELAALSKWRERHNNLYDMMDKEWRVLYLIIIVIG
jgi:hypothetical protein